MSQVNQPTHRPAETSESNARPSTSATLRAAPPVQARQQFDAALQDPSYTTPAVALPCSAPRILTKNAPNPATAATAPPKRANRAIPKPKPSSATPLARLAH